MEGKVSVFFVSEANELIENMELSVEQLPVVGDRMLIESGVTDDTPFMRGSFVEDLTAEGKNWQDWKAGQYRVVDRFVVYDRLIDSMTCAYFTLAK